MTDRSIIKLLVVIQAHAQKKKALNGTGVDLDAYDGPMLSVLDEVLFDEIGFPPDTTLKDDKGFCRDWLIEEIGCFEDGKYTPAQFLAWLKNEVAAMQRN